MMRIPRKSLAGKFERRDGLLSRHRRKRLQELVKRISGFKIVEKVLHGNARADKNGLAALDVRIAVNHDLLHTMAQSISETCCTVPQAATGSPARFTGCSSIGRFTTTEITDSPIAISHTIWYEPV